MNFLNLFILTSYEVAKIKKPPEGGFSNFG